MGARFALLPPPLRDFWLGAWRPQPGLLSRAELLSRHRARAGRPSPTPHSLVGWGKGGRVGPLRARWASAAFLSKAFLVSRSRLPFRRLNSPRSNLGSPFQVSNLV